MFEGFLYTADPAELREEVQQIMAGLGPLPASPLALGPVLSMAQAGSLMASSCASFADLEPSRIVVLACAPQGGHHAPIILPESTVFRSPLGDIATDQGFLEVLADTSTLVVQDDIPHLESFRIEVYLPFIQYLYPSASLVPILTSGRSPTTLKALHQGLCLAAMEVPQPTCLLVASNLSSLRHEHRDLDHTGRLLDHLTGGEYLSILKDPDFSSENALSLALFAYLSKEGGLEYFEHRVLENSQMGLHGSTSLVECGCALARDSGLLRLVCQ